MSNWPMAKPKRFARNATPADDTALRLPPKSDGDDKTRADQGFHGSASLQNTCATVGKLPA
jgi:hypothetical protein